MNSIQRTAIVVIVTTTSAATVPLRAAEDVRIDVSSATTSKAKLRNLVFTLDDGAARAAGDFRFDQLSTVGQMQPTKLKKISGKKALIITAVIVGAAIVIAYVVAISKGGITITGRNSAIRR